MHAPITAAADPEEKQQEEEDSMEGTYTVSAAEATAVQNIYHYANITGICASKVIELSLYLSCSGK